jgi:hypothetical protein
VKRDAIRNDAPRTPQAAGIQAAERKAIDDAFRGMADDKLYQREGLRIAEEFAASDTEALDLSERDLIGA